MLFDACGYLLQAAIGWTPVTCKIYMGGKGGMSTIFFIGDVT
jgi:hypothetical protein